MAAASVCVLGWCAFVLLCHADAASQAWLPPVGRSLGAELFLLAGAVRLARWRTTRARGDLRLAITLATAGVALPALSILGAGTRADPALAGLTPALVLVPLVVALGRGNGTRTARLAPVLVVPAVVTGLLVGFARLAWSDPAAADVTSFWVQALLGLTWTGLALRTRGRPGGLVRTTVLIMAAAQTARAAAVGGPGTTYGAALTVVVGLVLAAAAATDLRSTLHGERSETDGLVRTLADTRRRLDDLERVQRERLHDARSAVVAVLGATELLGASPDRTAIDRPALHRMMAAELARMQILLDTDTAEDIDEFDLADVLGPVVTAHRLAAPYIRADLVHVRVLGRPRTTATVLDNLLRNSRTHGRAEAVTVRSAITGGTVSVLVEDRGPGIPAAERATVLLPGVRGSTAAGAGSGLGLHLCAQAMQDQSGGIRVSSRDGGGTCVAFTLPVAAVPAAVAS